MTACLVAIPTDFVIMASLDEIEQEQDLALRLRLEETGKQHKTSLVSAEIRLKQEVVLGC